MYLYLYISIYIYIYIILYPYNLYLYLNLSIYCDYIWYTVIICVHTHLYIYIFTIWQPFLRGPDQQLQGTPRRVLKAAAPLWSQVSLFQAAMRAMRRLFNPQWGTVRSKQGLVVSGGSCCGNPVPDYIWLLLVTMKHGKSWDYNGTIYQLVQDFRTHPQYFGYLGVSPL